jgi:hypothetical protein
MAIRTFSACVGLFTKKEQKRKVKEESRLICKVPNKVGDRRKEKEEEGEKEFISIDRVICIFLLT